MSVKEWSILFGGTESLEMILQANSRFLISTILQFSKKLQKLTITNKIAEHNPQEYPRYLQFEYLTDVRLNKPDHSLTSLVSAIISGARNTLTTLIIYRAPPMYDGMIA